MILSRFKGIFISHKISFYLFWQSLVRLINYNKHNKNFFLWDQREFCVLVKFKKSLRLTQLPRFLFLQHFHFNSLLVFIPISRRCVCVCRLEQQMVEAFMLKRWKRVNEDKCVSRRPQKHKGLFLLMVRLMLRKEVTRNRL